MLKNSLIGCEKFFDVEIPQSIAYALNKLLLSGNRKSYHREYERNTRMNIRK